VSCQFSLILIYEPSPPGLSVLCYNTYDPPSWVSEFNFILLLTWSSPTTLSIYLEWVFDVWILFVSSVGTDLITFSPWLAAGWISPSALPILRRLYSFWLAATLSNWSLISSSSLLLIGSWIIDIIFWFSRCLNISYISSIACCYLMWVSLNLFKTSDSKISNFLTSLSFLRITLLSFPIWSLF